MTKSERRQKVVQPWPRTKLALNLKIVRQERHHAKEDVGTEETPVITPGTPCQLLTNIIRVKLRRLGL